MIDRPSLATLPLCACPGITVLARPPFVSPSIRLVADWEVCIVEAGGGRQGTVKVNEGSTEVAAQADSWFILGGLEPVLDVVVRAKLDRCGRRIY